MKKYLIGSVLFLLLLISCGEKENYAPALPVTSFNYTDELVVFVDNLSNKTEYMSLSEEHLVATTRSFSISNKYVIPFLYYQLANQGIQASELTGYEIEDFLFFNGYYMAQNELIYKEAVAKGVLITDEEFESESKKYLGDNIEAFREFAKTSPLSFDFVMEDLKKNIIIEKYKSDVVLADIQEVTDEEALAYYTESPTISRVNPSLIIRHIQVNFAPHYNKKRALNKITKAHEELLAGKDFAGVAKKYSEDESTKERGGLFEDFVTRGSILENVERVAFDLSEGEVSDVFEISSGYEIIKVDQIKDEGTMEYDDMKDGIKRFLSFERQNKAIQDEIDRIVVEGELKFVKK